MLDYASKSLDGVEVNNNYMTQSAV